MNEKYNSMITEKHTHKTAIMLLDKDDNEYTEIDIQGMIYEIRGSQVMLDSDLALLYGYSVKRLNEQVKRNTNRFPTDFMFQLSEIERDNLWSQIATTNINKMSRSLPYVFTEQGVNQLSAVLKGPVAEKQSVLIMRTFVKMRHSLNVNKQLINSQDILRIENRVYNNEQTIHRIDNTMATQDDIQNIMDNFILLDKIKEFAFLKGEKFEADELFINLYSQADHSIYIIDNYFSIKTLSHLKHKKENVNVIIFTTNSGHKDKLRKAEFDDFNSQYPPLSLKNNPLSHDRYIILDYNTDKERLYHSGASIKDVGQKVCSVNEITDKDIYHNMIDTLLKECDINL